MSRPPQHDQYQLSAAANRRNIIDFVGVPVGAPQSAPYSYDDHLIQSMYPPSGPSPYAPMPCAPVVGAPYAPLYPSAYPATPYMQSAYAPGLAGAMPPTMTPTMPPTMLAPGQPPFMASPYSQYPTYPPPADAGAGAHVSSQPSVTEESLRNKINSKIESIMEMQKADMLSNQIEKLTNKVQKLSQNIENKAAAPPARSAERNYVSSSASRHDDELDARLRRLAAESSRKASLAQKRGTMDW